MSDRHSSEHSPPLAVSVEKLYGTWALTEEEVKSVLAQTLHPRGPEMLFDLAATLGVGPEDAIVDVGCRDAKHLLELVRRLGCRGFGVEPVRANLDRGRPLMTEASVVEPGVASRVSLLQGRMEALPFRDGAFRLVWARDMLIHVPDLTAGLRECRRVLRPSGRMLAFQMFATPLLDEEEAGRLWPPLAAVPRNTDPAFFEQAVADAGLIVQDRDEIRSEWREYAEEQESGRTSEQLLSIARLLRDRERFVELFGPDDYESELANALWGVYQMIGKLSARVYVLAPS
jgi:ubiquinone/menaquinone biosynthesis C-methylase UbiE